LPAQSPSTDSVVRSRIELFGEASVAKLHSRVAGTLLATVGVVSVTVALGAAGTSAAAASQNFSSSFEAGDPQPAWTDTVDGGKTSGVTGPKATGIPGNVTDKVVEVTANGENSGSGEVKENLTDGDIFSK
jgi:hypothetical protein